MRDRVLSRGIAVTNVVVVLTIPISSSVFLGSLTFKVEEMGSKYLGVEVGHCLPLPFLPQELIVLTIGKHPHQD